MTDRTSKLRELVGKWREMNNDCFSANMGYCADELEALLPDLGRQRDAEIAATAERMLDVIGGRPGQQFQIEGDAQSFMNGMNRMLKMNDTAIRSLLTGPQLSALDRVRAEAALKEARIWQHHTGHGDDCGDCCERIAELEKLAERK